MAGIGYASLKQSWGGFSMSFEDYLDQAGVKDMWNSLPGYMQEEFEDEFDAMVGSAKESSASASRFVFNIGVGGEYDLTENLMLNLEIKYQYMKDFNRMPITLGIAYKF